jgi:hypothetical protein
MFLALRIPNKSTTVKSIFKIKTFGEYIITNYHKPVGKCISETSLENILQYLEKEYLFCSRIFQNKKAAFIRIHYSHKEYNSECLTLINKKGNISNHFFLYHMKKRSTPNPEAVLFHELAHALHVQCFGDVTKVPDYIIDILQDLCFPIIKQMDNNSQSELFADVLSVGLMYQSPYEKFILFKEIHPDVRNIFKMLVEKMIEKIKVN